MRNIDKQAARCAALADSIQELLHGHDMEIVIVVMLRVTAAACHSTGIKREDLERQFRHVIEDVYSTPAGTFQETVQ